MSTSVAINNIGSVKSNLKSGMKKIGIKKEIFFINSKYVDGVEFHLTKTQYKRFVKNK